MSTAEQILCFYQQLYNPDNLAVVKNKTCFQSRNTDICWDLNFTKHIHFQSLEVVCRGSETQLQVTENLNWIAHCSRGLRVKVDFFHTSSAFNLLWLYVFIRSTVYVGRVITGRDRHLMRSITATRRYSSWHWTPEQSTCTGPQPAAWSHHSSAAITPYHWPPRTHAPQSGWVLAEARLRAPHIWANLRAPYVWISLRAPHVWANPRAPHVWANLRAPPVWATMRAPYVLNNWHNLRAPNAWANLRAPQAIYIWPNLRAPRALTCYLSNSKKINMFTMQCNAMQCNAMQCNAMQCNAMQCNAMQCNAMQCNAMQCNAMQCNALHCTALHCTTLHGLFVEFKWLNVKVL